MQTFSKWLIEKDGSRQKVEAYGKAQTELSNLTASCLLSADGRVAERPDTLNGSHNNWAEESSWTGSERRDNRWQILIKLGEFAPASICLHSKESWVSSLFRTWECFMWV